MTREKFIKKWLSNLDYQYTETDKDLMRDDLDLVINQALPLHDVMHRFPSNPDIWKWWKTQKFQKEQGEQEYMMIYEIDLPKILKAFSEHLLNTINY